MALGVPEAAARDFVLGHLRIQIAVLFKEVNGTFSDAAYKISKRAKPILFKENWQKIFESSLPSRTRKFQSHFDSGKVMKKLENYFAS